MAVPSFFVEHAFYDCCVPSFTVLVSAFPFRVLLFLPCNDGRDKKLDQSASSVDVAYIFIQLLYRYHSSCCCLVSKVA